jgi:hypothetical protein
MGKPFKLVKGLAIGSWSVLTDYYVEDLRLRSAMNSRFPPTLLATSSLSRSAVGL